jgi:hypothetical protein
VLEGNPEGWSDRVGNPERRKNKSEWKRGSVQQHGPGKREERGYRGKSKVFSRSYAPLNNLLTY